MQAEILPPCGVLEAHMGTDGAYSCNDDGGYIRSNVKESGSAG